MMIVMKETATSEEIDAVVDKIERAGALAHRSRGARVTVIGAIGDVEQDVSVEGLGLEGQPGVDRVVPILKPYKLASLQITHGERTVLDIEGRKIGGDNFALIAGPCTVESREQTLRPRAWCATPAPLCSAAAPTSRAPPPTPSRASARRA